MTVTLDLTPEQEAHLRRQAQHKGQDLPAYLQSLADLFADPATALRVAIALYEDRRLTQGQAAQVAGLSRTEFFDALGRAGVSPFQYDLAEAQEDADMLAEREARNT